MLGIWVGIAWHGPLTRFRKFAAKSRRCAAFDSSRGDLDILLSTKWPRARPGGCLPPRLSALPRGYFQEDEWKSARRSGPAKGRGNRGKIVTRRAEICGPNGPCPRVDPLARNETAGGAPGGQGRAARKARGVGRCSRRTSRARSWARVSSSDCTRSRAIRICPNYRRFAPRATMHSTNKEIARTIVSAPSERGRVLHATTEKRPRRTRSRLNVSKGGKGQVSAGLPPKALGRDATTPGARAVRCS